MTAARLLMALLVLLALTAVPSTAAPLTGACSFGSVYDPACDVNQDGTIDIFDVQLIAGHWGQTGTYYVYPALVPKTGQTVSYFPGDDGDLERGLAWPMQRFIDQGNGSVTDVLTGLVWLKNANCFGHGTWDSALTDANALNSGECGLSDGSAEGTWRLPNVRELYSLLDIEQRNPGLPNGHPFTDVQVVYWSSTTVHERTWGAWWVSLNGDVDGDYKTASDYVHVWPVREVPATMGSASGATPMVGNCAPGAVYDLACDVNQDGDLDIYDIQLVADHWGHTGTYNINSALVPRTGQTISYGTRDDGELQTGVDYPVPRFTDNLNGTVTDNLTGLIWLRHASCFGETNWMTALTDANALNSGECGLSDGSMEGAWRLPNVRELHTLVDYGANFPSLVGGHPFTDVEYNYWSSTTTANNSDGAWRVELLFGGVQRWQKDPTPILNHVWPVQGGH